VTGTAEPLPAIAIPDVNNEGTAFQAYYDAGRKGFWIQNSRGGWIEVTESSLRRLLRKQGYRAKAAEGEILSELDTKLNEIQLDCDVAFAGPLAGYSAGVVDDASGSRILVTTSPKLIAPAEGEWPVLGKFLRNLLIDDAYDQRDYVFAWLKFAAEALNTGRRRPGPAMVLAGPRNCGKSLLQKIFTEVLGGRVAKPYRYMSGRTDFNGELFGAEHLMVEDETPSTDLRSRRSLGAHIKAFTVNETQSCHSKNRQALTLTPFWRVSISVNDEPENLLILPPMSDSEHDSLGDKIILLRARKAEMPMPSEELDDREAFWRTLRSELPAFLYFLQHWSVPEPLRHSRYGMRTWQHPTLLAALDALAPETRLLGLIDEVLFSDGELGGGVKIIPRSEWEGTAEQLERLLVASDFGHEAKCLLNWSTATGTYLSRLSGKRPDRVQPNRKTTARKWIVYRPSAPAEAAA
jgi:hypothetical protein